jgi:hypothetical protein
MEHSNAAEADCRQGLNLVRNSEPQASVTTRVDATALSVTVSAQQTYVPKIGAYFWAKTPTIKASATAKLSGSMPLCLLALDPKASTTVSLEASASMTATGCMIYSNSTNKNGLQAKDNAKLTAGLVCTAGGKAKTGGATVTPEPVTDCPRMADPLRSRVPPQDTTCRFNDTVISGVVRTLQPGVYCKGLKITAGAQVTLTSGVYIIKDGPLVVDKAATLIGTQVGIYLTGPGSNLTFATESTISLSAPKDGPLAGLLIYDDPNGASAPAIPAFPLPIPIVGGLVEDVSIFGRSLCSLRFSVALLRAMSSSRLSASEKSSSSPPQMTRPSAVVRMYRYGSEASQIMHSSGHRRSFACGTVAMAQVDVIL